MPEKICPVCGNHSHHQFSKKSSHYFQCTSCKMLFCDAIDQEGLVGGGAHEERNQLQNHLRIKRINEMTLGSHKEDVHILDFGCGFGRLVEELKAAGYTNTVGYDSYNPDFSQFPSFNKFHIVTMVEVIEHIPPNFIELDFIHKCLLPGGAVYVETSFTTIAEQENIPLSEFFYVNPDAGHCSIHSHHSLDVLFCTKGFVPVQHFDRNCRLFKKVKK